MSAAILIVGSYADPEPIGGNRVLAVQALTLSQLGERIEVLTWPHNDTWRGPRPDGTSRLSGIPYTRVERSNLPFHIVECPRIWAERILTESEWEAAVAWAMNALRELQPRLVHHHYWQNLWWILDAAQRLGIPTVYSAYDYGIACLRTILVNGWGDLCTERVSVHACSQCIFAGRNLVGKANELVARLPLARPLLATAFGADGRGPLGRAGGMRLPVGERVGLTIARCRRVLGKAGAVVVASPFSREFFGQFVDDPRKLHVLPWFHNQSRLLDTLPGESDTLRLGATSRLSPEKGPHVLLDALARVKSRRPVTLKIAGDRDSRYAVNLFKQFGNRAGDHTITWNGWQPNDRMREFYADVDAAVIPSLWYDNTPIALVEALAHGRPVVCTDVPSMTHLVRHNVNGLVFPMGDVGALARQIERLADEPDLVARLARRTRNVDNAGEYARNLRAIYDGILHRQRGAVS
jgi:glycosyltransferase involved in cell wall biosynthesis